MERHLGNSVREGALLRVVSHGSAKVEDPSLASHQGWKESLCEGQGGDQVDLQGKLEVGDINVGQAVRVADGCILHQKCNASIFRKASDKPSTIRLLRNVRLDNPNIIGIIRQCFCLLQGLQSASTREDLVGFAEMFYNCSSNPGSSSSHHNPKTTCHCTDLQAVI